MGGLGLGYSAVTALENQRVGSLLVIDLFPEVIGWHKNRLVPMGAILSEDEKMRAAPGRFFRARADGLIDGP